MLGYDRAMATLSRSDVEHVAYLARLGLTDDELTLLEGQLNHILDQYTILATLDTDAIRPRRRPSSSRTSCARTSRGHPFRRKPSSATRPHARVTSSSSRRSSPSATERCPDRPT